jgi:hypothetical protein
MCSINLTPDNARSRPLRSVHASTLKFSHAQHSVTGRVSIENDMLK